MPFSQKKDTQRQQVLFSKRFALALEIAGVRLSPTIVQSDLS